MANLAIVTLQPSVGWRRGVAQLAEHRSPKPGVAGSSPAAPVPFNAGSARPILSRGATDPGSVGCPRRAELRAHLQRRLHGLARGAAAPHPRRLRDVSQPDHEMAFGHAGVAGRWPQGDRHPPERRLGPAPRLRHRGRHGPEASAELGYSPRSRNAFAAEKSASATSTTRTSRRPSRSGRKSRRGRRSARRAWVFGTCTSRSG